MRGVFNYETRIQNMKILNQFCEMWDFVKIPLHKINFGKLKGFQNYVF